MILIIFVTIIYRVFLFRNHNHHEIKCKFVLKTFITNGNNITLTYDLSAFRPTKSDV